MASNDKEIHKIQKQIRELMRKQQEKEEQERIDTLLKVQSTLFDKASAYTNIVIAVGYAGLFTIWEKVELSLGRPESLGIALCLTFSLLFFVGFEIFKMLYFAYKLKANTIALSNASIDLQERLEKYDKARDTHNLVIARAWKCALFLTISPAIAAILLLLNGFLRPLFS